MKELFHLENGIVNKGLCLRGEVLCTAIRTSNKSDYTLEQISKAIGAFVSLDIFPSRADISLEDTPELNPASWAQCRSSESKCEDLRYSEGQIRWWPLPAFKLWINDCFWTRRVVLITLIYTHNNEFSKHMENYIMWALQNVFTPWKNPFQKCFPSVLLEMVTSLEKACILVSPFNVEFPAFLEWHEVKKIVLNLTAIYSFSFIACYALSVLMVASLGDKACCLNINSCWRQAASLALLLLTVVHGISLSVCLICYLCSFVTCYGCSNTYGYHCSAFPTALSCSFA